MKETRSVGSAEGVRVHAVHHVNLRISPHEIRGLRDFYCDVLGLKEGWRPPFASKGYWLYADEVPIVHLVETSPGETRPRGGVIDHVSFRCTNPRETESALQHRGIEYSITQVPVTGDTQIFLRDPVGNGVELTFIAQ
jgi:catechol 2,3-dioxygenase-like lactoylglutathione lyase family enzyme